METDPGDYQYLVACAYIYEADADDDDDVDEGDDADGGEEKEDHTNNTGVGDCDGVGDANDDGDGHGDCARKIRGSVGVEGEKAACSGYRFSELNKFVPRKLNDSQAWMFFLPRQGC